MMRHRIVRAATIAAALFFIMILLPAFTLAPVAPDWAPEPLRNWAYDARLMVGRPLTTVSSLVQALKHDSALYLNEAGETITFESDGIHITGTVYNPDDDSRLKPAILLLHGSTPQGRKLGLYRLLGRELANQGYVTLAIDQRGFGQSDDPPDVNRPESFDYVADVQHAISYLLSLPNVDPDQIYVVGHSFGGDVAMTAVTQESRINKLVIIGPGRRFIERGGSENAPEMEYFKRREMRYMFLWHPIPTDVFLQYRSTLPLENHLDYFANPEHAPILLLDGAQESAADQAFLQEAYETMTEVKAYITLDQADHYANVANIGPIIIYDQQTVAQLIQEIDVFLQANVDNE
jgi:pimeloyl-ACP methyl ester carboxylesterase